MKYRKLGRTGFEVSEIAHGLWGMGDWSGSDDQDSLRALRWYLDPANRAEAIDIVAKFVKQPPARFERWIFTKNDFYRDPDGLVNLEALQSNIALMRQLGVINADLDAAKYARLDLVREAASRLK